MSDKNSVNSFLRPLSAIAFALLASNVSADTFEVTITNATRGETFTPRLITTHTEGNIFVGGQPALPEVATIAESGNVTPAMELLANAGSLVTDTVVGDGLLGPGESQQVQIEGNSGDLLTLIAMLIPTNDAFVALDAVPLPESGSTTTTAVVYDAGTEPNDELCANIPGPRCMGEGDSPDVDGEGFIHVHAGIHGGGDLAVADYDWRNPAAKITIRRLP